MQQRFYHYFKFKLLFTLFVLGFIALMIRLTLIMVFKSQYYYEKANDVVQRERQIKAKRGLIYDRNGRVLADNQSVYSITVIHNQIEEPEKVIRVLSKELDMDEEKIRKRVEKVSSIEKIKSNVPKEVGDRIRGYQLKGVNVDEDYKRIYPYGELASKVLGFTGGEYQGIVGLEVIYDELLTGKKGKILTTTDVRGIEVENKVEMRIEPVSGYNLYISIDYVMQTYVQSIAEKIKKMKNAKSVSIILMNPQNGEIYAMTNVPEYDLNQPFTLTKDIKLLWQRENSDSIESVDEHTQDLLNQMWRNGCVNDTYEPGSTFKIITATAAFEKDVVNLEDTFSCPGFRIVDDRRIRCHKTTGHGLETFTEGFMNSCNPVFIDVGTKVGAKDLYDYFNKLGLFEKTGIDIPGESASIMHRLDNIGNVELATISFGQSFQITPLQLLRAVSAVINGGELVTPHFGIKVCKNNGDLVELFEYQRKTEAISKETSEIMKLLLHKVVSEGTGKNAFIEGFDIGGKTATSQKLPRGSGKYIASFVGFAPVNDPQVIGIVMIDEPEGLYYGGTIAAPVMREIFDNLLPYMKISQNSNKIEEEENKK